MASSLCGDSLLLSFLPSRTEKAATPNRQSDTSHSKATMSFSGDGIAHTSRPSAALNSAKVNQLEEFTVRVPLDGDKHVGNVRSLSEQYGWSGLADVVRARTVLICSD